MNHREKVIAGCVGVAVLLYGGDQYLVEPYFDRLSTADDLVTQHQSDLEANQAVTRNRTTAVKQWKAVSAGNLATDPSSSESQLLARVQQCARDASMSISTLKPEKADKEKGYDRILLRATGSGTMQQIAQFLFAVQGSGTPVKVADLQLTTKKEGTDDLEMNVGLTAIYQSASGQTKVAAAFRPTEAMQ